jgi:hypothetical protein
VEMAAGVDIFIFEDIACISWCESIASLLS